MAGFAKFGDDPVNGSVVRQKGTIGPIGPDSPYVGAIPWVPSCLLRRLKARNITPGATQPTTVEIFEGDPRLPGTDAELDCVYYNNGITPQDMTDDFLFRDIPYAENQRRPLLWLRVTPGEGASTSSRYKMRIDAVLNPTQADTLDPVPEL